MYIDNEYASSYRAPSPVMDKHYFIAKLSAIPDDQWCCGTMTDGNGRRCAVGHCGGSYTKESYAIGELFCPGEARSGMQKIASINDNDFGSYWSCGQTPKARVLWFLNQLPDPVPTNIRAKVGVEEVRVVVMGPEPITSWTESKGWMGVDNTKDKSSSFTITVNPKFWNQPVLQP